MLLNVDKVIEVIEHHATQLGQYCDNDAKELREIDELSPEEKNNSYNNAMAAFYRGRQAGLDVAGMHLKWIKHTIKLEAEKQ
jgi:hypothetical protein